MSILLVAATPLEMEAVLAGLMPAGKAASLARALPSPAGCASRLRPGQNPETAPFAPQPRITRIRARGRTLFLLLCGVGPVSAGLHMGLALGSLRRASLCGALNLGIAGSYDETLAPLGSVVGASCEIFPEFGVRAGQNVDAHALGFAQIRLPGGEVVDRIPPLQPGRDREALARLDLEKGLGNMGLNCHTLSAYGPSVTVSGVSGDPACADAMARRTGGLTENMEGFALALGAARCNLPFAELRAVSNAAGCRPPRRWDIPNALAALTKTVETLFTPQRANPRQG